VVPAIEGFAWPEYHLLLVVMAKKSLTEKYCAQDTTLRFGLYLHLTQAHSQILCIERTLH
jgi:hypothetical protein